MYSLKFDEQTCLSCSTCDCLMRCQYISVTQDEASDEMMKIIKGEESRILQECATCYACEEYCQRGNHPFYLISDRLEERGMQTAARAVTNQWINMCEPQGKHKVGKIQEDALSCCFTGELRTLSKSKLFSEISPSYLLGAEFLCQVVYLHFAKPSIIRERLPKVIENIAGLGIKRLVCLHDECYAAFSSLAPAYGFNVPFEVIHYFEYLYDKLKSPESTIRPLRIKVAYQRPCSSRLSPDKHLLSSKILHLIGAQLVDRVYQDKNALCCGEILRMVKGYELANDIQKRNIDDIVQSGAEYCVFNCPYCQMALSEKIAERGVKPVHLIEVCEMALSD